jgi:hypothetical protein
MPTHVITVNGNATNQTTGDAQIPILQANATLTNDQIINLPSSLVEILPAPGANKMILFHSAVFHHNFSAGAYTDAGGYRIIIVYGDYAAEASILTLFNINPRDEISIVRQPGFNTSIPSWSGFEETSVPFAKSSIINQPLKLYSDKPAPYTGGNAANTLVIDIYYSIIDLS